LRLRGSWRGKVRGDDINIDHKAPARPKWLIGEGKKCWDRIVPILHKSGLATELNRETLALLCAAWADFVDADQQLCDSADKNGKRALTIETSNGTPIQNPLLSIRRAAWEQVYKAAACFGLTPADLSRVRAVEKPEHDNAKSRFFESA
jgi:P27 family predicted phage terminase small subunit